MKHISEYLPKAYGPPMPYLERLETREVEARVESPIEQRMLGILNDVCPYGVSPVFYRADRLIDVKRFIAWPERLMRNPFMVFPQVKARNYRLDFLVVYTTRAFQPTDDLFAPMIFALECDGEEFHRHRQAEDRQRDENLAEFEGLPTMRVKGRDILARSRFVRLGMTRIIEALEAVQRHQGRVRESIARPSEGLEVLEMQAFTDDLARRYAQYFGWFGLRWQLWALERFPRAGASESAA